MCEPLGHKDLRARKAHRCHQCGVFIMPGEMYRRSTFAEGGDIWDLKEHVECHKDANDAPGLYDGGECTDQTLWDWFQESGVALSKLGLQAITVERIERSSAWANQRRQTLINDVFSMHPEGRWADDGGRV